MYVRLHRQRHGGRSTPLFICARATATRKRAASPATVSLPIWDPSKNRHGCGTEPGRRIFPDCGSRTKRRAVAPSSVRQGLRARLCRGGNLEGPRTFRDSFPCRDRGETTFPTADLVELMVVNRLCDPCSKLALLGGSMACTFPGMKRASHRITTCFVRWID